LAPVGEDKNKELQRESKQMCLKLLSLTIVEKKNRVKRIDSIKETLLDYFFLASFRFSFVRRNPFSGGSNLDLPDNSDRIKDDSGVYR
jgi:hypothetical protein